MNDYKVTQRTLTIELVEAQIREAHYALGKIESIPADGLTIDAAAMIHRHSLAIHKRIDKMEQSLSLLRRVVVDF